MKKRRIIINESQFKKLVNESLGISDEAVKGAKAIFNEIIENCLDLVTDEGFEDSDYDDFEEYAQDICDDYGIEEAWSDDNEGFYYGFYYIESNSKGKYDKDDDVVWINYYGIIRILRLADRMFSITDAKNKEEYTKETLYEYLMPILSHELTHRVDNEGAAQGRWLGNYYKGNEEDLRNILYIFSENEMNARVGSVFGVVSAYIDDAYMGKVPSKEEFDNFASQILDSNDLDLEYMATWIDYNMSREVKQIQQLKTPKARSDYKKYSLLYDLFRNDERLQNRRNLKYMFDSNSPTAYKAVYDFYDGLYKIYKKRILRAIYQVWMQYRQNITEGLLREQASPILWHYTYLPELLGILKSNSFRLSYSIPNHYGNPGITGYSKKRPYYMCTTRSKMTYDGYSKMVAEDNTDGFVRIELDGDKLNSAMHAKASDYFGLRDSNEDAYGKLPMYNKIKHGETYGKIQDFYKHSEDNKSNEREDTLWYNKEYLPNANKYMNRIDVCIPSQESFEQNKELLVSIKKKAEKLNIPIFFHSNEDDFNRETVSDIYF